MIAYLFQHIFIQNQTNKTQILSANRHNIFVFSSVDTYGNSFWVQPNGFPVKLYYTMYIHLVF